MVPGPGHDSPLSDKRVVKASLRLAARLVRILRRAGQAAQLRQVGVPDRLFDCASAAGRAGQDHPQVPQVPPIRQDRHEEALPYSSRGRAKGLRRPLG